MAGWNDAQLLTRYQPVFFPGSLVCSSWLVRTTRIFGLPMMTEARAIDDTNVVLCCSATTKLVRQCYRSKNVHLRRHPLESGRLATSYTLRRWRAAVH